MARRMAWKLAVVVAVTAAIMTMAYGKLKAFIVFHFVPLTHFILQEIFRTSPLMATPPP